MKIKILTNSVKDSSRFPYIITPKILNCVAYLDTWPHTVLLEHGCRPVSTAALHTSTVYTKQYSLL